MVAETIKTYSSETRWRGLWREACCLYENHRRRAADRVERYIDELQRHEARIEARFGREVRDMDVLDIGPGPFLVQMCYFAQCNRVTGIDLNVIPNGFAPGQYLEMWRRNGFRRALKTIIRKAVGIDRQYRREVARRLNRTPGGGFRILQMDAKEIRFPACAFDLVHSRSVFHHIPDPGVALAEVARVLRPKGIAIISFHLFTSETGSLDPRVYTHASGGVLRWPHLRRDARKGLASNAFVNGLRLKEWREQIQSAMAGAEIILGGNHRDGSAVEAAALRESGELAEYSLEELLTDEVIVVWQKPGE